MESGILNGEVLDPAADSPGAGRPKRLQKGDFSISSKNSEAAPLQE